MSFYKKINNIDCFIYFPEKKEHLYDLSKNTDLLFLKVNSKSYYKLLLKSFNSGIIFKILDWDYDLLKQEFIVSIKLKYIINFIDYISYFEFEDNFIHYINNIDNDNISSKYIDKCTDEKAIIAMHNYSIYNIDYIDVKNIENIFIQLILSLYSAYINHNIYFSNFDNNFIFIVKNKSKKHYRYYIKTNKVYLNNCYYKILICDLSSYNYCYNDDINIDDIIINLINNLCIFNKKQTISRKKYNYIKKKYIS